MNIPPLHSVPAAPFRARIKAKIMSLQPLNNITSIREIMIFVQTIVSGNSPFISPETAFMATIDPNIPIAAGQIIECQAEYIGDEHGGKLYVSNVIIKR